MNWRRHFVSFVKKYKPAVHRHNEELSFQQHLKIFLLPWNWSGLVFSKHFYNFLDSLSWVFCKTEVFLPRGLGPPEHPDLDLQMILLLRLVSLLVGAFFSLPDLWSSAAHEVPAAPEAASRRRARLNILTLRLRFPFISLALLVFLHSFVRFHSTHEHDMNNSCTESNQQPTEPVQKGRTGWHEDSYPVHPHINVSWSVDLQTESVGVWGEQNRPVTIETGQSGQVNDPAVKTCSSQEVEDWPDVLMDRLSPSSLVVWVTQVYGPVM